MNLKRPRVVVAVAVVVGLATGGVVVKQLTTGLSGGGGGASSPESAVQQLASAASQEDMLAALSVLPPEEVRRFDEVWRTTSKEAGKKGWANHSKPLGGVDVEVSDLRLTAEPLADTVTKVTLEGGDLAVGLDAGKATAPAAQVLGRYDEDETSTGFSRSTDDLVVEAVDAPPVEPFVMTIKRDGRWYVSPAYTAMEYLRLLYDLPAGRFDEELDPSEGGAESPEAVVRKATEAAETLDVDAGLELLPPDEAGALYAYRDALHALVARSGGRDDINQSFRLSVDDLRLASEVDGDVARVTVESSTGTFGYSDEQYRCADPDPYDDNAYSASSDYPDCYWDDTFSETSWDQQGACTSWRSTRGTDGGGCVEELVADLALGPRLRPLATAQAGIGDPYLVTIKEGGRWYLSPIGSLGDLAMAALQQWEKGDVVERALVELGFGRPVLSKPDGTLRLNEPQRGTTDALGWAVYTIDTEANANDLAACVTDDDGGGVDLEQVHGEARVVVVADPKSTFTVLVSDGSSDDLCATGSPGG